MRRARSGTATRRTLVVRRVLVTGQVRRRPRSAGRAAAAGELRSSGHQPRLQGCGRPSRRILPAALALLPTTIPCAPRFPTACCHAAAMPQGVTAVEPGTLPFAWVIRVDSSSWPKAQLAPGESVISPSRIRQCAEVLVDALGMSMMRPGVHCCRRPGRARAAWSMSWLAGFWPTKSIGRQMYCPQRPDDLAEAARGELVAGSACIGDVRLTLAEGSGTPPLRAYYFPIARLQADRGVAIVLRTSQRWTSSPRLQATVRRSIRRCRSTTSTPWTHVSTAR